MNSKHKHFALAIFFIVAFSAVAKSQDLVAVKYEPRTLTQIIDLNREGFDQTAAKAKLDERSAFIGVEPYRSRVKLTYAGSPRPISTPHLDLIRLWGKLQRVDKKFVRLYETEALFKEGDVEYWIPVQKEMAAKMNGELKSGDQVTLFVIYVGAQKQPGEAKFSTIFLANAYEF